MLQYTMLEMITLITLIMGDPKKEFFGMNEENAYLWKLLNINGHTQNELIEIGGYSHEIT